MTGSGIAGILIKDLLLGKENPWAQAYSPSRKLPVTSKDVLQGMGQEVMHTTQVNLFSSPSRLMETLHARMRTAAFPSYGANQFDDKNDLSNCYLCFLHTYTYFCSAIKYIILGTFACRVLKISYPWWAATQLILKICNLTAVAWYGRV
jgi:hypothetical protein